MRILRKSFAGMLFTAAAFAEVLPSVGFTSGTWFTDTRQIRAFSASVSAYPSFSKHLGVAYNFQFSRPSFDVAEPFSISKTQLMHYIGPIFRFRQGRFEPWVSSGALFYKERTKISLQDCIILDSQQSKKAVGVRAGMTTMIWKKIFVEPGAGVSVTARPTWQVSLGIGWKF